jgi:hypothetical protein
LSVIEKQCQHLFIVRGYANEFDGQRRAGLVLALSSTPNAAHNSHSARLVRTRTKTQCDVLIQDSWNVIDERHREPAESYALRDSFPGMIPAPKYSRKMNIETAAGPPVLDGQRPRSFRLSSIRGSKFLGQLFI